MMAKTILALGEVLWDIFPDGPRFGGAPANFACASAELGAEKVRAMLVSDVGPDDLGTQALARLSSHGVDNSFVTIHERPTGQVLINLDSQGRASYRFVEDPAWDHIGVTPALLATAKSADVIHFGTLGQRAPESRWAIREILAVASPTCLRVLDINLRAPHWSKDVILESLQRANVLKLNDEELPVIAQLLGLVGSETELLHQLLAKFSLKLVALTRGANGSRLLVADGTNSDVSSMKVAIIDTVGAGDAYTAALVLGLTHGLALDAINAWASEVAAFVCTQPGATPTFPKQYHLKV
jgi:fructokinase